MNGKRDGHRDRSRRRNRRGGALVEFALVAPVLIILVLGVIDAGQFINVGQTVNNASREGARIAAKHETISSTDVENAVANYLTGVFPGDAIASAVTVNVSGEGGVAFSMVECGDPVSVEVILDFDSIRWLRGVDFLAGRTITTTTVMRKE